MNILLLIHTPNIFSLTLLCSGLVIALMSLILFRKLSGSASWFGWIMLTIAIWSVAYGFELYATTLPAMLFWIRIEYIGISLLPACWILFVLKFTGKDKWLNMYTISLIFAVPIITVVLVWTNAWHHLQYKQINLDMIGSLALLNLIPGPWYWVHTVCFYLMLSLGSYFIVSGICETDNIYRRQNLIILGALLIPWILNLLYLFNIRPHKHIDLTPYGFIITAALICFGLFKYKLLSIVPIARAKVIEAMQEGVLVLDKEGRVIDYNLQLEQFLSFNHSSIVGLKLSKLLPEQEMLQQLAEVQKNTRIEIERPTTEGTLYLEVNSRILFEKNGQYSGLLLLFRDITGQKTAQKQAESAYNLLAGILDSSQSGVMAFRSIRNEQNQIIDFESILSNQKAITSLSAAPHNLVGKRLSYLIRFIKDFNLFSAYQEVVETGQVMEKEIYFEYNQQLFWMHLVAVKLEDGFTVTFSDISERKKAEQLLRNNEANLSALIENTTDLTWSIDRDYRLMTVNSAFRKAYGSHALDHTKTGAILDLQLFHQGYADQWKQLYERAWKGEAFTAETEMTLAEGIRIFESSLNPIRNTENEVEGITIFSRNITHRKQAEKEIHLAKEAAENASRFKTRFLANITHEIRTPINAILGFSEILQKQHLTGDQREYVNYILAAGDSLLKLIGDVLDLTKIEQGKMSFEQESFHLKETMDATIQPYQSRAEEKGLFFSISYDPTLPAYLKGDKGKIGQVLVNLIGNALKFTRYGGIHIKIAHDQDTQAARFNEQKLETGTQRSDQVQIRIQVSDSGIGIAKEQQEQIFHSFTQADSSINREFGGSGLGLSIAKEMVLLMGGKLGVTSPGISIDTTGKGGQGSTFWFTFPIKVDHPEKVIQSIDSGETENIHFFNQVNILMVEDNLVNQRLAKLILIDAGCKVVVAGNGEEALSLIREHHFDLIFMDLQMPVMDGYTATEKIRLSNAAVPIIGLSANVYKEDIEQCYKVGMNDYLGKPYSAEKLLIMLKKWVKLPVATSIGTTHKDSSDSLAIQHELPGITSKVQDTHINLQRLQEITGGIVSEMKEMLVAVLGVEKEFSTAMDNWLLHQEKIALPAKTHKFKSCLFLIGLDNLKESLDRLEYESKTGGNEQEISQLCIHLKNVFSIAREELQYQLLHLS